MPDFALESERLWRGWSWKIWLVLVLMLAAGIRTSAVVALDTPFENDARAYLAMASSAAIGGRMLDNHGNLAFYSAGYPLLMAALFPFTGSSLVGLRLVQLILGIGSVWLVFQIGATASRSRRAGLIAAFCWAVYIEAAVYTEYIAKENVLIPLLLGAILVAYRARQSPMSSSALLGFLFGCVALVGNSALFYVPAAVAQILAAAWHARRRSDRAIEAFARPALCAFVFVLAASVVIAPWILRNARLLGVFALNTNAGFNLYIGNNPNATGYFIPIQTTPIGPEWQSLRLEKGEAGASRHLGTLAWAYIRAEPWRAGVQAVRKAAIFWTPPFHEGEEGRASRGERLARLLWLGEFVFLELCVVLSVVVLRRRGKDAWPMWFAVAGYTAVHMLYYVSFRYRFTITPVLCILAGWTLVVMWDRWRQARAVRERPLVGTTLS
jgi:hypothetical protein